MWRPASATRAPQRRALIAAFAAAFCAVVAAAAEPAVAANDGGLLSILVMGDSYSAGNGAGSYIQRSPTKCYRSSKNYAREFEREVEKSGQRAFVENVACSDAVTDDFFGRQEHRDVPNQLDAVNNGYDIIFLTIGGNDLDFKNIVKDCLIKAKRSAKDCGPSLDDAERIINAGPTGQTLERRVKTILTGIKQRADPRAKIVLLGYPYLEGYINGQPGFEMRTAGLHKQTVKVAKRVRELGRTGDTVQRRVISQLNKTMGNSFVFVPTKDLFAGNDPKAYNKDKGDPDAWKRDQPTHELFADYSNDARWLVAPSRQEDKTISLSTYYHPNPRGWHEEARLLARNPRIPRRDINSGPAPGGPGPTGPGGPVGSGPGGPGPGGGDEPPPPTPPTRQLRDAATGYLYVARVPRLTSSPFVIQDARSSDLPEGLRLYPDGNIVGVMRAPGLKSFTASWVEPDFSGQGPRQTATLEVKVSDPPGPFAESVLPGLGFTTVEPSYGFGAVRRSPDGRYIAATLEPHLLPQLVVVSDTTTGVLTVLARGGSGSGGGTANLAWSPDSTRLVFTSSEAQGARHHFYDLYAYDVRTKSSFQITKNDGTAEAGDGYNAAWSPDGGLLAFNFEQEAIRGSGVGGRVALWNPATNSITALDCASDRNCGFMTIRESGSAPWSSDGQHLTYSSTEGSTFAWDRASGTTRKLAVGTFFGELDRSGTRVLVESGQPVGGFFPGQLVNVETGGVLKELPRIKQCCNPGGTGLGSSSFSADGRYYASSAFSSAYMLDTATGVLREIQGVNFNLLGFDGQSSTSCGRASFSTYAIECKGFTMNGPFGPTAPFEGLATQIVHFDPAPLVVRYDPTLGLIALGR